MLEPISQHPVHRPDGGIQLRGDGLDAMHLQWISLAGQDQRHDEQDEEGGFDHFLPNMPSRHKSLWNEDLSLPARAAALLTFQR
jgi:hypothetical protein